MTNVVINETTETVIIDPDGSVDVVSVGIVGPPGAGTSDYNQLINKPTLGTAAATDIEDYAAADHTHSQLHEHINKGTLDETTAAYTVEQQAHLDSIEFGAQVNEVSSADVEDFETTAQLDARDTANRSRANHTGEQPIETVAGLQTALDGKQAAGDYATNTALSSGLAQKADATDLTAHTSDTDNPHSVTKAQVGLGNVDNTSDVNKPVSTAQAAADATKVSKAGDTMTGSLYTPNIHVSNVVAVGSAAILRKFNVKGLGLDARLSIQGGSTADGPGVEFTNDGNLSRALIRMNTVGIDGTELSFWTQPSAASIQQSMTISQSGNVGIGLTNPLQRLHVDGNARINGVDYLVGSGFPNGVVSAPVGSTYVDTNVTNGALEWKKASGTGNTGWIVSVGKVSRNISGLANIASGNIYLERRGDICQLYIVDVRASEAAVEVPHLQLITSYAATLPGFSLARSLSGVVNTGDDTTRRAQMNNANLTIRSAVTTMGLNGTITYATNDAWPSTLPGTQA